MEAAEQLYGTEAVENRWNQFSDRSEPRQPAISSPVGPRCRSRELDRKEKGVSYKI